MVGGPRAAFERVLPIFEVMGKNIVHIGDEPGAGQIAKACNQIIVGITIMAVAEARTLARKAGVDPATVRQALLGGFAQSRILELHGQRMLDHNFQPGFRIRLHQKDLGIALAAGKAHGVPLLTTALVHEVLGALVAQGHQDWITRGSRGSLRLWRGWRARAAAPSLGLDQGRLESTGSNSSWSVTSNSGSGGSPRSVSSRPYIAAPYPVCAVKVWRSGSTTQTAWAPALR